jgi:hypothetical protein
MRARRRSGGYHEKRKPAAHLTDEDNEMADEISRDRMAEQARLASAILAQGRSLDHWSLTVAGLAWIALMLADDAAARIVLFAPIALGLLQRYFALRVGIDAEIFGTWADRWQRQGTDPLGDLERFDEARAALGSGAVPDTPSRPLTERVRAALAWFRWQAAAFAGQVAALALALSAGWF